jgi:hypothetical protein
MFTDYPIQELCMTLQRPLRSQDLSVAMRHTLACAKAQTGAISEAIEDLRMVVSQQGNVIKSADWLVIGMIAEQCGLTESARQAYEKVQVDKEVRSAYELAQLRLKCSPKTIPVKCGYNTRLHPILHSTYLRACLSDHVLKELE